MKALDYCVFKNRHDMAVVLQEFVDCSEKSIIDIKSYELLADYATNASNIQVHAAYLKMLAMDPALQYKQVLVAPLVEKTLGLKFTKSLRRQVANVEHTPFAWVDNEADLQAAVAEIETCLAKGCNAIAVDLEYHCIERHASILCLLQLSTIDKDYIFDSLLLREKIAESRLKTMFEDPTIVKIFHGSETDLQLLATDLDIVTVNVFDTARAFQYLQRLPE